MGRHQPSSFGGAGRQGLLDLVGEPAEIGSDHAPSLDVIDHQRIVQDRIDGIFQGERLADPDVLVVIVGAVEMDCDVSFAAISVSAEMWLDTGRP